MLGGGLEVGGGPGGLQGWMCLQMSYGRKEGQPLHTRCSPDPEDQGIMEEIMMGEGGFFPSCF